ncbi:MAG TPA: hypothetical protein VFB45_10960 [Pseudolabrys sp.]|jgi:hypothetical protein|nr:hypothetical protein [Pseudolabrys sp.]
MNDNQTYETLCAKAAEYRIKAKDAADDAVASALEAVAREYERLAQKLLAPVTPPESPTPR